MGQMENIYLWTYFYLFLPCNWFPILCTDSSLPVNADSNSFSPRCMVVHPKACQVVTSLSGCESKLTMCYILFMVKIVSKRWCDLKSMLQWPSSLKLNHLVEKSAKVNYFSQRLINHLKKLCYCAYLTRDDNSSNIEHFYRKTHSSVITINT